MELAVANALDKLCGYPHGMDSQLEAELGVPRRQLEEVFGRWRVR